VACARDSNSGRERISSAFMLESISGRKTYR
jgi:hypothetical protein